MAQLTVNGISLDVLAPAEVENEVLEVSQRAETGGVRTSRHGDSVRALDMPVTTDYMTDAEKDALEDELLAPGPATVGGDLFASSFSAHLIPQSLAPGPLADMWRWTFRIRGVGS